MFPFRSSLAVDSSCNVNPVLVNGGLVVAQCGQLAGPGTGSIDASCARAAQSPGPRVRVMSSSD